MINIHGNRF